MKNSIIICLFLSLVLVTPLLGVTVDINKARLTGKNFYFERISHHQSINYQDIRVTSEFTEREGTLPLYYILNINDKGFIIVAADDAVYPVLGYSFETSYSPSDRPSPEFSWWMDVYRTQIIRSRANHNKASEPATAAWERYSMEDFIPEQPNRSVLDVEPLTTDTWYQDFPYNSMCPADTSCSGTFNGHVPVGCVATAMAQIMRYWQYPVNGNGSHCYNSIFYGQLCANFGATTYQWEEMSSNPTDQNNAAAQLSYQCGVSVDMIYFPTGSSATTSDAVYAYSHYFKYDSSVYYQNRQAEPGWSATLRDELEHGRPIQYRGQGPDGGHSWVMDGYQGTDYFHMNWGWGGMCNGYFYLNSLTPDTMNFSVNQGAVLHILPDSSFYPYECSGQTDTLLTNSGSFDDGSGPVKDYQNNISCSWLILPDDSISQIRLYFKRFKMDSTDVVEVYDGSDITATLLATLTGNAIPQEIISSGPKMFIRIITDNAGTANGFLAEYQGVEVPFCADTTFITGNETDQINDGSGRFNYRNGTRCVWIVNPYNPVTTTLYLTSINTESGKDIIDVYNLSTNELLGSYSGIYDFTQQVDCSGCGLKLVFTADSSERKPGWEGTFLAVGAREITSQPDITLFPVPSAGIFFVRFSRVIQENLFYEVFQLNGQTVNSGIFSKGIQEGIIDLSLLPQGMYALRITGSGSVRNMKLVISR